MSIAKTISWQSKLSVFQVVYSAKDNSIWQRRNCWIRHDPQVRPFDGDIVFLSSDDAVGDFLLYKHTDFNFEIHIRQQTCSRDIFGYCACAVAIQGGGDIFIFDVCGSVRRANFRRCQGNVLNVREISPREYEVCYIFIVFDWEARPRHPFKLTSLIIKRIQMSFE